MTKIEYPETVTITTDEFKELTKAQERINITLNLYELVTSIDRRELFMILTGKKGGI